MKFIGWTSGKYMGDNMEKEKRKKKYVWGQRVL